MGTFIIIIITIIITAAVTFYATRSLYTHLFVDWYRTAIDSVNIEDESEKAGKKMYNKLAGKYARIFKIDHTIIPEWVKDTMSFTEEPFTSGALRDTYRAARWLGFDLILAKRKCPPPPEFKKPTLENIRKELVACWDAEGRLMEQDKK